MTLSEAAKKWLKQHGLQGFLRIVEAPLHGEAEKVVKEIDSEVITEEAIRALIGLPEGDRFSINNPTPKMLTKYFGEWPARRTAHKAVRTPYSGKLLVCSMSMAMYILDPRRCPETEPVSS